MDAATGSNNTQSPSVIFDHFLELGLYIGNNATHVGFQAVQGL